MKPPYKLFLHFLSRSRRVESGGMVLIIAGVLGIVCVVAAAALLARAQSDKQQVTAQHTKSQGAAVAEVAMAQVQNVFSQNPLLAKYSPADWAQASASPPPEFVTYTRTCQAVDAQKTTYAWQNTATNVSNMTAWSSVDSNDSTKGQFKIVDYSYDSGNKAGTLTVQGKSNTDSSSTEKTALKESAVALQIQMPVVDQPPDDSDVPGLWIKEGDMSNSGTGNNNNTVAANVWLGQCSLGETIRQSIAANVAAGMTDIPAGVTASVTNPYVKFSPLEFPDLPQSSSTLDAILTAAGTTSTAANKFVNVSNWTSNKSNSTPGYLISLDSNDNNGKVSSSTTTARTGGTVVSGCTPSSTSGYFPQVGDIAISEDLDKDGTNDVAVYNYVVSTIDKASITIVPGCRVKFHLAGNLDKNTDIVHDCGSSTTCKPTDMQILAYGTGKDLCINGGNNIDAFVFAPFSNVGVLGGGNRGGVKGTVWAKTWNKGTCGSNTRSTPVVVQTASWTELGQDLLPKGLPPKLGSATTFTQVPVN